MSKATLYPVPVKAVTKDTEDTVVVGFEIPKALKEVFSFRPGQYLTLEAIIDSQKVRRSYSLCSKANNNTWEVAIKKVPGGLFSTYANEALQAGMTLDVMPPQGSFVIDPSSGNDTKHYVAIVAGSGITPVMSMIRTYLEADPRVRFTLLYGNKNTDSIIFREALEDLKNQYLNRLSIFHIFSRERQGADLLYGRINAEKCETFFTRLIDKTQVEQYLLCGPGEMIFEVKEQLEQMGVASDDIRYELFTTAGMTTSTKATDQEPSFDPASASKVSVILDGITTDMVLTYGAQSILDAAMESGLDMPYACKGGVCSTCKAKVIAGKVDMDVNFALEPDELAAGFVLTCQAHPRSPEVVVDFDDTSFV